jgi:hypothetical protein
VKPFRISHKKLLALLHYDPETGIWTWLQGRCAGKRADLNKPPRGYRKVTFWRNAEGKQRHVAAHRLAWFYMTKRWPKKGIDHKDGVTSNNTWINLREADQSQNNANSRPRIGTSELKGVSWHSRKKKWTAQIRFRGITKHLGQFDSAEDAHAVYCAEANRLHGDFARVA